MKQFIKKIIRKKGWVPKNEIVLPEFKTLYNPSIAEEGIIYKERQETGAVNFAEKIKREEQGGDFEWPNMVALNQAITQFIGNAETIINIGSGTGTFEWFASIDNTIKFTASEFDNDCLEWCKQNRQRPNIEYCSKSMNEFIENNQKFDLAVSVDVLEHIEDFGNFLKEFSQISDRAIITTPNKDRELKTALRPTPAYHQHCREWNAGEFYWILRVFYKNVDLYAMPDVFVPKTTPIGLMSTLTPLIAVCSNK